MADSRKTGSENRGKAKPRSYPDFLRDVKRQAGRLDNADLVSEQEVLRAVEAVGLKELDEEFFADNGEAPENHLERLVGALAIAGAMANEPIADKSRASFLLDAVDSLYELKSVRLFSLRLRLLDELIDSGDGRFSMADLHFKRANTRVAMGEDTGDERRLVTEDLDKAASLAVTSGDLGLFVDASSAKARRLARNAYSIGIPDRSGLFGEVSRLRKGLSLPLSNERRATLLHAIASLERVHTPAASADTLAEAMALLPGGQSYRIELGAERVSVLTASTKVEEAVALGRALLEEVTASTEKTIVGMLHCGVAEALIGSNRVAEAEEHLASALEQLRGNDIYNEIVVRFHLVTTALGNADQSKAEHHLSWLWDHWERLRPEQRVDYARTKLAADLRFQKGLQGVERVLEKTLGEVSGTRWERVVRLELANVRLQIGKPVPELDRLITDSIETEADNPNILELVGRLSWHCRSLLRDDTLRAVAAHAEMNGEFAHAAALLAHLGTPTKAIEIAEKGLGTDLSPIERLQCLHSLIINLPKAANQRRIEVCVELERLLDDVDVPEIRADLAAALWQGCRNEEVALWKAWNQGQKALKKLDDERRVELAELTLAYVAMDLLKLRVRETGPENAELAEWFLRDLAFSAEGNLSAGRLDAAFLLLAPELTPDPARVVVAEQLISRVEEQHVSQELLETTKGLLLKAKHELSGASAEQPRNRCNQRARKGARQKQVRDIRPVAERVPELFQDAVHLMDSVRADPAQEDSDVKIAGARRKLSEAARLARKKRLPELFHCLVSLGNAWKLGPRADVEKALRCYRDAEKVGGSNDQLAQLWKCKADALQLRGGDGDLRQAERLLRRAMKHRSGRFLAETLLSLAMVIERHPDLEDAQRAEKAVEALADAVQASRDFGSDNLPAVLQLLAKHAHVHPDRKKVEEFLERLKNMYSERAAEITRGGTVPAPSLLDTFRESFEHPAMRAFVELTMTLRPPVDPSFLNLGAQLSPSELQQLREQMQRTDLRGQPEGLEAYLAKLPRKKSEPQSAPGVAVATVWYLAELARCRRRREEEVRQATADARSELDKVESKTVRASLLCQLASAWAPDDHSDPVLRDFDLAAELSTEAVRIEGGEETCSTDSLECLARCLRYSTSGGTSTNLDESERLYRTLVRRAKEEGVPNATANAIHNLADVIAFKGSGEPVERLREAIQLVREAILLTANPMREAQYRSSLAWDLTCLAQYFSGEKAKQTLEEALGEFDRVNLETLPPAYRRSVERHRSLCEEQLAVGAGDRGSALRIARDRLSKALEEDDPVAIPLARHNLANALLSGGAINPGEVAEGLELCRSALEVRTIAYNPRHCWETSFLAGDTIAHVLHGQDVQRIRRSLFGAAAPTLAEGAEFLRLAIQAARAIGGGEELLRAGLSLGLLSVSASSVDEMEAISEDAWTAVSEAGPALLRQYELAESEARIAAAISRRMAATLAEEGVVGVAGRVAYVLSGERTETVLSWLARSRAPLRRSQRARLERPRDVSERIWMEWRRTVATGKLREVATALEQVRSVSPGFLRDGTGLEATWNWLDGSPGSIAVVLSVGPPIPCAAILYVDSDRDRHRYVLGLEMDAPPVSRDDFVDALQNRNGDGEVAEGMHHQLTEWARLNLVEPIINFLGISPNAVLWSADDIFRLVSPASIWQGIPVASTVGLGLPERYSPPGRHRSTMIAMADPGDGANGGFAALGDHGLGAIQDLVGAAGKRGEVRVLASAGKRHGPELLPGLPGVPDSPASVGTLIEHFADHDVVVLIAHGQMDTAGEASIVCVDAEGKTESLSAETLEKNPDCLAGATVLLLSCETGRVGIELARPGGIAGTLIAAGARCVVGPMWPVKLDVAARVIVSVLDGLAAGVAPWESLAAVGQCEKATPSPELGPAPSVAHQESKRRHQESAFVTWVG